jgi:hypothetical protein
MRLSKPSKHLKAASLVESVIAIVIITLCVSIAFLIYIKVVQSEQNLNIIEAHHKIEEITHNSKKYKVYTSKTYNYNNYKITKEVEINEDLQIVYLNYTVLTNKKSVIVKKIIPYEGITTTP